MRVGPWSDGISALLRRHTGELRLSPQLHKEGVTWWHSQKQVICKPGQMLSSGARKAIVLIFDFLAYRTVRKCLSTQSVVFCYGSQSRPMPLPQAFCVALWREVCGETSQRFTMWVSQPSQAHSGLHFPGSLAVMWGHNLDFYLMECGLLYCITTSRAVP